MRSLHLEELESRQLLNGSSFAPPSWHQPPLRTERERYHEQRTFADQREPEFSFVAASRLAPRQLESWTPEVAISRYAPVETISFIPIVLIPVSSLPTVSLSVPTFSTSVSEAPSSAAAGTTLVVSTPVLHAAARVPGTSVNTSAEATSSSESTVEAVAPTQAAANRSAVPVASVLTAVRNGTPVATHGTTLALVFSSRLDASAGTAETATGHVLHSSDGGASESRAVASSVLRAPLLSKSAGKEEGGAETEGNTPQFLDAARTLSVLELAAAEQGMRRFLDQLEQHGRDVAERGSESTPSLWVMAWGTALVACELARRQLRRSAPGLEWNQLAVRSGPPRGKA